MSQPEDRVVPLCGCRDGCEVLDPIISHDGISCVICNQPVTAINIDAMQRKLDRVEKLPKQLRAYAWGEHAGPRRAGCLYAANSVAAALEGDGRG